MTDKGGEPQFEPTKPEAKTVPKRRNFWAWLFNKEADFFDQHLLKQKTEANQTESVGPTNAEGSTTTSPEIEQGPASIQLLMYKWKTADSLEDAESALLQLDERLKSDCGSSLEEILLLAQPFTDKYRGDIRDLSWDPPKSTLDRLRAVYDQATLKEQQPHSAEAPQSIDQQVPEPGSIKQLLQAIKAEKIERREAYLLEFLDKRAVKDLGCLPGEFEHLSNELWRLYQVPVIDLNWDNEQKTVDMLKRLVDDEDPGGQQEAAAFFGFEVAQAASESPVSSEGTESTPIAPTSAAAEAVPASTPPSESAPEVLQPAEKFSDSFLKQYHEYKTLNSNQQTYQLAKDKRPMLDEMIQRHLGVSLADVELIELRFAEAPYHKKLEDLPWGDGSKETARQVLTEALEFATALDNKELSRLQALETQTLLHQPAEQDAASAGRRSHLQDLETRLGLLTVPDLPAVEPPRSAVMPAESTLPEETADVPVVVEAEATKDYSNFPELLTEYLAAATAFRESIGGEDEAAKESASKQLTAADQAINNLRIPLQNAFGETKVTTALIGTYRRSLKERYPDVDFLTLNWKQPGETLPLLMKLLSEDTQMNPTDRQLCEQMLALTTDQVASRKPLEGEAAAQPVAAEPTLESLVQPTPVEAPIRSVESSPKIEITGYDLTDEMTPVERLQVALRFFREQFSVSTKSGKRVVHINRSKQFARLLKEAIGVEASALDFMKIEKALALPLFGSMTLEQVKWRKPAQMVPLMVQLGATVYTISYTLPTELQTVQNKLTTLGGGPETAAERADLQAEVQALQNLQTQWAQLTGGANG